MNVSIIRKKQIGEKRFPHPDAPAMPRLSCADAGRGFFKMDACAPCLPFASSGRLRRGSLVRRVPSGRGQASLRFLRRSPDRRRSAKQVRNDLVESPKEKRNRLRTEGSVVIQHALQWQCSSLQVGNGLQRQACSVFHNAARGIRATLFWPSLGASRAGSRGIYLISSPAAAVGGLRYWTLGLVWVAEQSGRRPRLICTGRALGVLGGHGG
jgi:hypothetical protein